MSEVDRDRIEAKEAHMSPQDTSLLITDHALYKRMTLVMHAVIFLYSAAFWIQVGVLPVSAVQ